MSLDKPRLYCNTGQEDKAAIRLLTKAGIPYVNLGPTSEEPVPFVEYGYWRFSGIQGIQTFILKWQSKKLPPLDELR